MVVTGIGGMPPPGGPPGPGCPEVPPHPITRKAASAAEQKANARAGQNEAGMVLIFEVMAWEILET
jgi:hypothetical protein